MSIAYAEPAAPSLDGPSAIFRPRSPATKVAVSALFLVATAGSTTAGVPPREPMPIIRGAEAAGGLARALEWQPATDAELVKWLHDESGLTWDQIARTFDVSRRAVHLWANGGRVSAGNAEALQALVALVRNAATSSRTETRAALLAVGSDGMSLIDRFRRAQHAASRAVTGTPLAPRVHLGDAPGADQ